VGGGTTLKGLSDITGRTEGFFSKTGVGVGAIVGIETGTGVTEAVEIVGFSCKDGFEKGTISRS
jgi:Na+-translocating ferredoxin:NAD+ oxidoreductase RnfE subunit